MDGGIAPERPDELGPDERMGRRRWRCVDHRNKRKNDVWHIRRKSATAANFANKRSNHSANICARVPKVIMCNGSTHALQDMEKMK